jgi:hypothetical protein
MSTPDTFRPKESRVLTLAAVSDWLKLLALIVLVAEVVIPIAMWQTPKESSIRAWYPVFMLLFLVVIVIGVFVDRYFSQKLAPPPPAPSRDPDAASASDESFSGNQALNGQLTQIRKSVQHAAAKNIPTLTEEMSHELDELAIHAREWSNGEMHSSVQRYNKTIIDLYEHAKRSIFSTTIRDYATSWPEDLMDRMIAASLKSKAAVVKRVFVFGKRDEIDEEAVKVLKRFEHIEKVIPLVYIDDEDRAFDFPSDISRDFVVIDEGEAIGVTVSYGTNLQAKWFFQDEDRKRRFARTCEALESGSKSLKSILDWWNNRPKPASGAEMHPEG